MTGQSTWAVPAISALSSLLGTVVGGVVTYWTSKASFERQQASEQNAQRTTQLRDAATRFIAAVTDDPLLQTGLARISDQWGPLVAEMAATQTDQDFVVLARTVDPAIPQESSREKALVALMRSTGAFDDDIRHAVTLLTELRLVAPLDVAESAQRVLYAAATRELAAALTPQRRQHMTTEFNREVNDFFNHVRHHMNVEDIDFDFFNEGVLQRILKNQPA